MIKIHLTFKMVLNNNNIIIEQEVKVPVFRVGVISTLFLKLLKLTGTQG